MKEFTCDVCPMVDSCAQYYDGFFCIKKQVPDAHLYPKTLTDEEKAEGVLSCEKCDFRMASGCPAEICWQLGIDTYFNIEFEGEMREKFITNTHKLNKQS